jgi:acyl-CoA dehydrogenase
MNVAAQSRVQMPSGPPVDDAAFLAEVRAFLGVALTADLREAGRGTLGVHSDIAAGRLWHRRLFERGWAAPVWPIAWGGAGWSMRQKFLFDRECALNDAPILFAGGVRSLGPLLIEMGTPEQRARFIPGILSGDDLWCQGFSEPSAGSDLVAVTTRAVRVGDCYRVTGSKIWTTGAHHSNRMFAIVRTADGEKPHHGLTFLLIDMASPGLTVVPIIGLAGDHEFNQVFFDAVEAPVRNRVGDEGCGWTVAKRLMQLARSNNTPSALIRRVLRRAAAASDVGADLEPGLRARLAALAIELEAFEAVELHALARGTVDAGDPRGSSMLKLIGSELHQKVAELAMQIAGPAAAAALQALAVETGLDPRGAKAMAKHLCVRAASVYSGTSEIQRNVIGKYLLGA